MINKLKLWNFNRIVKNKKSNPYKRKVAWINLNIYSMFGGFPTKDEVEFIINNTRHPKMREHKIEQPTVLNHHSRDEVFFFNDNTTAEVICEPERLKYEEIR